MAVANGQGREKPTKIEQRKGPQVEQTALLASPIYIGQAQGEEKKHIKREAKAHAVFLSLSPPHAGALPHSLLTRP